MAEGYTQRDLQVVQYVTVTTEEIIPPIDPSAVPLYRNLKVEQPTQQNSIVGFRGDVDLTTAGGYNNHKHVQRVCPFGKV